MYIILQLQARTCFNLIRNHRRPIHLNTIKKLAFHLIISVLFVFLPGRDFHYTTGFFHTLKIYMHLCKLCRHFSLDKLAMDYGKNKSCHLTNEIYFCLPNVHFLPESICILHNLFRSNKLNWLSGNINQPVVEQLLDGSGIFVSIEGSFVRVSLRNMMSLLWQPTTAHQLHLN